MRIGEVMTVREVIDHLRAARILVLLAAMVAILAAWAALRQ